MAFPGPHAQIDYNEAGEPLGWDYPSTYEPGPEDLDKMDEEYEARMDWLEQTIDELADMGIEQLEGERFIVWYEPKRARFTSLEAAVTTWRERTRSRGAQRAQGRAHRDSR